MTERLVGPGEVTTEVEWLRAEDPQGMLKCLQRLSYVSQRK
jgi:hypothetical protein